MRITTIGLDLAKNVLQLHGVNENGVAVLRKQLKRNQIAPFFERLEPCLIGIEACGGGALLGRQAHRAWTSREDDGAAVRQAVCQDQQE